MVDKDGTSAYSRMRSLSWEGGIAFAYPNPVIDRLYLNEGAAKHVRSMSIDNLAGIAVLQAQAASHLDVKTLPAGMYILKVIYQDGSVRSQKIVRGK